MTINVLRGRVGDERDADSEPVSAPVGMPIGEADAEIFNCPVCTRPLARGVRRCPGCKTRLVLAIPLGRAALFTVVGFLVGALAGGGLVVGATAASRSGDGGDPSRPGGVPPVASPSTIPVTPSHSPATSPAPSGVPSAALAALGQSVTMNGRLLAGGATLRAALADSTFDTALVVRTLRSLNADAAWAADATKRLETWTEGRPLAADLGAFYASVRETAREALQASMSNAESYRRSAGTMAEVLDAIPELDAASRALAGRAGINLPPLATTGASPAP